MSSRDAPNGSTLIKVSTYNINSSSSNYRDTREQICDEILAIDADIALINELYTIGPSFTDSLLQSYYPYSRIDCGDVSSGVCLYSKYPIVEWRRIDSGYPKNYIYEGSISVMNQRVIIVGCHLCSNNYINDSDKLELGKLDTFEDFRDYWSLYNKSKASRNRAIDSLLISLDNINHPTIILGDFNDFTWSNTISKIEEAGYADAWWKGGTGYGSTYKQGTLSLRLDHIFYSEHFGLETIRISETNASDHNPIYATLFLKD